MNSSSLAGSWTDQTPIGTVVVYATAQGCCRVDLLGRSLRFSQPDLSESELSRVALQQILEYLAGKRRSFELPLDDSIFTPFQRTVLTLARTIEFGQIRTYGELAQQLGKPAASRAIGGAMAHNPIPILIPCHRVVAADGRLIGYSAADGIQTKKWLLELEGHRIVGEKLA
jgi:methylated-DNA-[protein]-cysteine S-methyltransferase